ncbi:MAG: guanylate kinase [Leptolyngbyaceae cyanobacterium bins.59]|nr:guanylate kinase [Leptolyngbyaceae cyanobacterium bins.59]
MGAGRLIVLTGPSGVGKGTLLKLLLKHHTQLHLSVSVTTRSPRPGEVDGQHYYFVDRPTFQQMVETNQLLEWAEFAGNCYGTPRLPVEEKIRDGKWVILEIELQGARQIRKTFPEALRIFILPPSFSALEQRIRRRAQDSEDAILSRLATAKGELAAADEFDLQIINDDLTKALQKIESALFSPVPSA